MSEKNFFIENLIKKFNLIIDDNQFNMFDKFEEYIKSYNQHTNLMSANDTNLIWEKHFVDSLAFSHFIDNDTPYSIIDIGSGGGFPLIPMAIMLTNSKFIAVDSTKKKTDFLEKTTRLLKINNVRVLNDRAENIAHRKTYREKFDIVTARAVGNLNLISELCLPFVKVGGNFLVYKSMKLSEEISNAESAIKTLGGEIVDTYSYDLNLDENFQRKILLIEKIKTTPDVYPRIYSAIKNKPL